MKNRFCQHFICNRTLKLVRNILTNEVIGSDKNAAENQEYGREPVVELVHNRVEPRLGGSS
jgi:hypothetical protein